MSSPDNLEKIGFLKNTIVESIVSTFDNSRKPHAAPMGAHRYDERHILLKPFKTSQTYSNLSKWKSGVVNITSDPIMFYLSTFKNANPLGSILEEWFEKAESVDAPKLSIADAYLEFNANEINSDYDEATFLCEIMKLDVSKQSVPHAFCRATPAIIESLIHATRVEVYLKSGETEKAEERIRLINHYAEVIEKVAPNKYSLIIHDIQRRIDEWRIV